MKDKGIKSVMIILLVFMLILTIIVTSIIVMNYIPMNPADQSIQPLENTAVLQTPDSSGKYTCKPSDRGIKDCPNRLQQVCGWFNEDRACDNPPCKEDYLNGCFACKNSDVKYWTDGTCP